MSPITAKATEVRALQHHAQQLSIALSNLEQVTGLFNSNKPRYEVRDSLVSAIRCTHERIGELLGQSAMVNAEMYSDNRGLHP